MPITPRLSLAFFQQKNGSRCTCGTACTISSISMMHYLTCIWQLVLSQVSNIPDTCADLESPLNSRSYPFSLRGIPSETSDTPFNVFSGVHSSRLPFCARQPQLQTTSIRLGNPVLSASQFPAPEGHLPLASTNSSYVSANVNVFYRSSGHTSHPDTPPRSRRFAAL